MRMRYECDRYSGKGDHGELIDKKRLNKFAQMI